MERVSECRRLVKDIISASQVSLYKDDRLYDAIRTFQNTRLTIAPVVEKDGKVVGVFTKSCLFKHLLQGHSLQDKVFSCMKKDVITVRIDEPAEDVFKRLPTISVGQFVVVDEQYRAVGILAHINVVRSLLETTSVLAREQEAIIQAMHNGMVAINQDGRVTMINRSAAKSFGVDGEEIVGQEMQQVLPASTSRMLLEVLESGIGKVGEKDIIGTATVMANYSPIIKDKKTLGAICILQDVTEIEHLARELQSYKRVYKTLETVLDIAYEGIVVINRKGTVEWCNQPFAKYLDLKRSQIINKDIDDVFGENEIKLSARTGQAFRGNLKYSHGRYAIVSCQPIYIDGQVEGAVGKIIFKEIDDLKDLVKRIDILEGQGLQERSKETGAKFNFEDIITVNEQMKLLLKEAYQAARSDSTILLRGESGTGKELFAHAIHNASYRFEGPFLKINCAAVPEHLLESEFFGYEDGAFTGARKGGKPGKFELANGGTLFLDEIGDMPKILQSKLLRVLEDNEFTRLGGVKSTKVNVRIIASTNRDLEALIENGEFREDLYYRLNVISVNIPPLRERLDDIPILVNILTKKYNEINRKEVSGIDPAALSMLQAYQWPGNVRELENVIERIVSLNMKGFIYTEHLPDFIKTANLKNKPQSGSQLKHNYKHKIQALERDVLEQALKEARGNKTKAAKILGISRTMLYQKLKVYGIRKKYVRSTTYY